MKKEKKQNSWKVYLWLMCINLFISAFTFGGGYVVVPMIRRYFVQKKHYFSEEELGNMAAVAQSTPGAIAINLSALAGYQIAGIAGSIISCIAAIIPPLIILGIVSVFYIEFAANPLIASILKGMQAGVVALMIDFIVDMCQLILKERSRLRTILIPSAFFASFVFKINVALILLVACILCIGKVVFSRGRVYE